MAGTQEPAEGEALGGLLDTCTSDSGVSLEKAGDPGLHFLRCGGTSIWSPS